MTTFDELVGATRRGMPDWGEISPRTAAYWDWKKREEDERMAPFFAKFRRAHIADLEHAAYQRELNAQWRRLVDELDPVPFTNAKEGTMAARKKTATRRKTANLKQIAEELAEAAPKGPTMADRLAEPDPPKWNPEIEGVAQFVAVFMLFRMGFSHRELGALLGCSSSAASEMVVTGAAIADRNGLSMVSSDLGERMRAMRENAAADWAVKAAQGMQELIASSLPAFIRASSEEGRPCTVDVKRVVDLVEHFSATDDVVERSTLASQIKRESYATQAQNGCANDVKRAGELQAAEAYRGAYVTGSAGDTLGAGRYDKDTGTRLDRTRAHDGY